MFEPFSSDFKAILRGSFNCTFGGVYMEEDIPGASLIGSLSSQLKIEDLIVWLMCCGDSCEGLQTKVEKVSVYK